MTDLEKQLTDFLETNTTYQEALQLVRQNSTGNAWLIGSFLYRNLAAILTNAAASEIKDIDFAVEAVNSEIILPNPWKIGQNSFGGHKFLCTEKQIDVVPLNIVHFIKEKGLPPTIQNQMMFTPLTIQSIAYNTDNQQLLGQTGITALKLRSVGINFLPAAQFEAARKHLKVQEYITKVATDLNFQKK